MLGTKQYFYKLDLGFSLWRMILELKRSTALFKVDTVREHFDKLPLIKNNPFSS